MNANWMILRNEINKQTNLTNVQKFCSTELKIKSHIITITNTKCSGSVLNMVTLFNKRFASRINILKSDTFQLQVTRHVYSFISVTHSFEEISNFLISVLIFYVLSRCFISVISVIIIDNTLYFVLLATLSSVPLEIFPTAMMLTA